MVSGQREPAEGFAQLLRDHGLRVTATRLAVLRALQRAPHADAETLLTAVRGELESVAAQTVYSVVNTLVEQGIARRIEPAGSNALYELRVADNHHHVVCRDCRRTADIDCAVGRRPCLTPSQTHGFVLDEAEVTFWGLCPDCQARQHAREATARGRTRSARTPCEPVAGHTTHARTPRTGAPR